LFIILCGIWFDEYMKIIKDYLFSGFTNIKVVDGNEIVDLSGFINKNWQDVSIILFTDNYTDILEEQINLIDIIVKRRIFSIFFNSIMNSAASLKKIINTSGFSYFTCAHGNDKNFGEYDWPLNSAKVKLPYFGYFKSRRVPLLSGVNVIHADMDKILSFTINNQRIFISSLHIPVFLLIYMPTAVGFIFKSILDKLKFEVPKVDTESKLIFQIDELIFSDVQDGSKERLAYIMSELLSAFLKKENKIIFEKDYRTALEKLQLLKILDIVNENDQVLVKINEEICNNIIRLVNEGYQFKTLSFIVKGVMEE